jgi:23S rRNA pseudouridine1911/1915/1917 synthase
MAKRERGYTGGMKTVMERLEGLFPEAKKTTLREMVERKRVRNNGTMVKSVKQTVAEDAMVEVADAGGRTEAKVLGEGLKMVYFDGDLVVVDKPAGLLTATDAQEKRPTAWRILQEYFRKQNHRFQIHLIHRLDREASGLLVFARNWEAYGALKKQFFEHTITRAYEVVVHGVPREAKGRLEDLLVEDDLGVVHVTKDMKKGKLAVLDYEVVEASKDKGMARLRCTLYTGRKHQIRVQLAARGHAVCGDGVYGKGEEPPYRLALHAARLSLAHPRTGKVVAFESPAPGVMGHMFRETAKDEAKRREISTSKRAGPR